MNTMAGLFDDTAQAQQLVRDLVGAGISLDAISVIAPIDHNNAGASDGGAFDLLSDLGERTVRGIGKVVAAGLLANALGSPAASEGGILAALAHMGMPEQQAQYFAEGVRRGGALVAVQAENLPVAMVQNFLANNNVVDMDARGASWREHGWQHFDPQAPDPTASLAGQGAGAPPETELPATEQVGPTIGALTGGLVPGGFGAAGETITGDETKL